MREKYIGWHRESVENPFLLSNQLEGKRNLICDNGRARQEQQHMRSTIEKSYIMGAPRTRGGFYGLDTGQWASLS